MVGQQAPAQRVLPCPSGSRRVHHLPEESGLAAPRSSDHQGPARLGRGPLVQAVRQLAEGPLPAVEPTTPLLARRLGVRRRALRAAAAHDVAADVVDGLLEVHVPVRGVPDRRRTSVVLFGAVGGIRRQVLVGWPSAGRLGDVIVPFLVPESGHEESFVRWPSIRDFQPA